MMLVLLFDPFTNEFDWRFSWTSRFCTLFNRFSHCQDRAFDWWWQKIWGRWTLPICHSSRWSRRSLTLLSLSLFHIISDLLLNHQPEPPYLQCTSLSLLSSTRWACQLVRFTQWSNWLSDKLYNKRPLLLRRLLDGDFAMSCRCMVEFIIFILHGILHFGYADEHSWEMCYSEMRSSLLCMVLCILATPMRSVGRCAIRRCAHFCSVWCFCILATSMNWASRCIASGNAGHRCTYCTYQYWFETVLKSFEMFRRLSNCFARVLRWTM